MCVSHVDFGQSLTANWNLTAHFGAWCCRKHPPTPPCCIFSICMILIFTATSQNEIVNTFIVFSHNPMVTIKRMWTWLTSLRQSRKPFMSQYQSVCSSQWILNSYISSMLILTDWLWPKSWNSSGSTATVDENSPHSHISRVSVCANQSVMTSVFYLLHQSEHVLI